MSPPSGGRDLGQERHRILRVLQRELERHPAVRHARGIPNGRFRELRADLDPVVLGLDVSRASLRVTWWPAPDRAEFAFHYRDSSGFDCGWHREPNPRVNGWTHYQERSAPDAEYRYEPVAFVAETPPRLLWEVLDRLVERLAARTE